MPLRTHSHSIRYRSKTKRSQRNQFALLDYEERIVLIEREQATIQTDLASVRTHRLRDTALTAVGAFLMLRRGKRYLSSVDRSSNGPGSACGSRDQFHYM